LDRLIASPGFNSLPPEERQTALIFHHDFQKSGVRLPDDQRKKFVTLSSSIISLGRDFLQGVNASKPPVTLTRQDCEGVPESSKRWQIYALNRGLRSSIRVDSSSVEATRVLKFSTSEDGRKKVYVAQNTSGSHEIEVLENLLRDRAQLASLVGHRSYAEMLLKDKMGENPGLLETSKMLLAQAHVFCRKCSSVS
jgi:intermediate peptidase